MCRLVFPPGGKPIVVVVLVVVGARGAGAGAPGLTGVAGAFPVGTTTVDGALPGPESPCVSVPVAVAVSVTDPRSTSCGVTL